MDANALRRPGIWNVSVQLVILYCVAVALFYLIHGLTRRLRSAVPAFLAAAAANAAGVALVVYFCRQTHTTPRLAMVLIPLVFIVEAHLRRLRSEPGTRPAVWAGLAGAVLGLGGAAAALLRDAPLK